MEADEPPFYELGDIVRTINPPKKIKKNAYLKNGKFPVIDQSANFIAGWTNDATAVVQPPSDGFIIFGDHSCVLKFAEIPFAQGADGLKIIEVNQGINAHFVYAHLIAFPLLNDGYKRHFSELKRVKIRLPDEKVQNAVSGFLHTFDSKIALNTKVAQSLEKLAETMFKSWFIDFDPVKAKMAGGELAGLDEETALLFPSSLEQSESGYIPSGWQVVEVERLLTRLKVKGLAKSTPLKHTGRTLVLEQGDSVVAGFLDQDADVLASPASPKFIFGDHTCRMRLSTQPFSVLPNTIVLNSTDVNPYWAFQATRGLQSFETYRRHWMEFAQKSVIVPPKQLTEAFGAIVAPLYAQIDSLMLENRKLAAVRDAILPGLISGEIEIPEEMLAA